MSKRWTDINESLESSRVSNEYSFDSDMNDVEASMAISEAIAFSSEFKYISEGLVNDILEMNIKAEEHEYSCEQYIEEAFSIGGIVLAILGILILAWNIIKKSSQAVSKSVNSIGSSSSSSTNTTTTMKSLSDRIHDIRNRSIPHIEVMVSIPDTSSLALLSELIFIDRYMRSTISDTDIRELSIKLATTFKGNAHPSDINKLKFMMDNFIKTVGKGSAGSIGIMRATLEGKELINNHTSIKTMQHGNDSMKGIASYKSAKEYLDAFKSSINTPKKKYDRNEIENELKRMIDSKSVQIIESSIRTTGMSYEKYENDFNYVISNLESAKKSINESKDKLEMDKATIDAMNLIHANLLEMQASIQSLNTDFCIPGFQLFKLGVENLNKFIIDIEDTIEKK